MTPTVRLRRSSCDILDVEVVARWGDICEDNLIARPG